MIETESPAMESNGNAFAPDLPPSVQVSEWSMEQVPPPLPPPPENSDARPGLEEQQMPHVNSTELGALEKAVEQSPLLQEAQPPPPPPPPPHPVGEPAADTNDSQTVTAATQNQDGTESMQITEDGMELEEAPVHEAQAELQPEPEPIVPPEPEFPAEFDRLYRVCEENPEDFNSWVALLQYVEQENLLGAARKAFDVFFLRYPYCYGYWKKYADMEKKHGNIQVAEEVYRRGLHAIPLSVDLWLHYLTYIKENSDPNDPETEGRIRATYDHAVMAAGTDFRSDRLWESYVAWETEQNKLANVTAVYDRVLGIPTQLYSQHFQKFKDHVQNNHPKYFLSEEEFVQLRLELSKNSLSIITNEDGEPSAPAEELPPGTEDLPDPAKRVTEIENMRHKVIEVRQEVFNHNEHEVSKRWAFEEGIKRPYFHVKALERTQLNNWREYLEFETEHGTPERVVVLFERCLIACALYEEFWIKYAKYIEVFSTDGVRNVYKRACTVHLPRKPAIHLLWAAFEEQQNNVDEAREILKALEVTIPGLAMVRLRRVSLERRHGKLEEAEALIKDAIETSKNPTEASFYAVKLARHVTKVQKNRSKAKKILLDALEKDQTNSKLYLNLLELDCSGDVTQNEEEIQASFDRAIRSPMSLDTRILFAQRKVEFLEDFGTDINKLVVAYEEQQNLQKESDSAKRKAENGCDGSQEPDAKRQRVDEAATANTVTDMSAANSAYNYNWYQQHYGAWGQNSWGQYGQYNQYSQYYPPPPT